MIRLRLSFVVLLLALFAQGCSVYTAFTHPPKVDIEGLENSKGATRAYVMNQCGVPISSSKNSSGGRTELYKFYEGSSWAKGRGAFHLIADIFTIALWEIIAWPSELAARGDQLTAEAVYDNEDKLVSFNVLGRNPKELERVHQSETATQF